MTGPATQQVANDPAWVSALIFGAFAFTILGVLAVFEWVGSRIRDAARRIADAPLPAEPSNVTRLEGTRR